jgi:hypothetical protein
MSTGSMVTMENGQSLTDLFHKFIRMTVKTDDRDRKSKKKHSLSQSQQQQFVPSSSRRTQRLVIQPPTRLPPRHHKRTSTVAHYNVSPIPNENNSYSNTEHEEQDHYYTDHVRFMRYIFFFLTFNTFRRIRH